jgi:DNA-binding MarR family transcriptional regulator
MPRTVITKQRPKPPPTGDDFKANQELASSLRMTVSRLTRRLRSQHNENWSMHHYSVLARIEEDGPQMVGRLAELERVKSSSMSATVNKLVNDRLVVREPDPEDGRRIRVAITAKGTRALLVDRGKREEWLAHHFSSLSSADRKAMWRAIEIMSQVAEIPEESGGH